MGDFIEFSGKTTEEALSRAQEHFNAPLSGLEFEVITPGSSGLFGLLGAKKAKIRARVQAGASIEEQMAELAAVVSNNRPARPAPAAAEPAPRPQPEVSTPVTPAPMPTPAPVAPPRMAEPRPAPAPPTPAETPRPVPTPVPPVAVQAEEDEEPVEMELEPEVDLEAGETLDLGEDEEDDESGDLRLEQDPAVIEQARAVLARLVEPLDPGAQVVAQGTSQGIELAVQGQEAGMLIGRRGSTLEALQYLVVRIVSHQHGRPVRIVVDAGDYRRRRREALEETARRMAQKAKSSGRSVAMGPLAAQERRLIHLALKHDQDVVTLSRGRGELKKVIISPKV